MDISYRSTFVGQDFTETAFMPECSNGFSARVEVISGSATVTFQYSLDGRNWIDDVTTGGGVGVTEVEMTNPVGYVRARLDGSTAPAEVSIAGLPFTAEGGGGTVPGANGEVIFNNAGALGSDPNFLWDDPNDTLVITGEMDIDRDYLDSGSVVNNSFTATTTVDTTSDNGNVYRAGVVNARYIGPNTLTSRGALVGQIYQATVEGAGTVDDVIGGASTIFNLGSATINTGVGFQVGHFSLGAAFTDYVGIRFQDPAIGSFAPATNVYAFDFEGTPFIAGDTVRARANGNEVYIPFSQFEEGTTNNGLTNAQIAAIASPVGGLEVYSTDDEKKYIYSANNTQYESVETTAIGFGRNGNSDGVVLRYAGAATDASAGFVAARNAVIKEITILATGGNLAKQIELRVNGTAVKTLTLSGGVYTDTNDATNINAGDVVSLFATTAGAAAANLSATLNIKWRI